MRTLRILTGAVVACALVGTPGVASAQLPDVGAGQGVSAARQQEEAVVTKIQVAPPVVGERTVYLLGQAAPVTATITWVPAIPERAAGASGEGSVPAEAPLTGEVEFFDGAVSLGVAAVTGLGGSVTATVETAAWPAAGLRQVTAQFRPSDPNAFAAAQSPARAYRVVDTARAVPDVALSGASAATIGDARLEWTIANIWFSNFEVGFEREVLAGPVTLPEASVGTTIPEKQAYFFRPFTFTSGSGARDQAGNRVISFEGSVRLTSGSANRWDFSDPRVHIGASGDGYITAEFSGTYLLGAQEFPIAPTRVAIATFSGAKLQPNSAGAVSAEIVLNWAGQAGAPGTWAHEYADSFPNEFVSLLHPAINLFFARSSVATDSSKIPHPITLSFTETLVPDPKPPVVVPFTDVPKGHKFFTEIAWMYSSKLTTGVEQSNGTVKYLPKQNMTREAMAAFLYRAEGAKYVGPKVSPFADVKPGDKFYNEITWMYQQGLSTGIAQASGKPKYAPKSSVTREAMAAFMYRLQGATSGVPKVSPFVDVKSGDKFAKEIAWMYSSKLSTGVEQASGKPKYLPKSSVTREAMAAFLYRAQDGILKQ
ncbi:S-layer homology domain-containing protein [Leucobacter luti]|uniref:S-layer homology domain-containing protein n=1 Tax=Leucobacter luti TaxID=340320 RepID=UPI001C68E815|nr:S-layer homology domain-containing protein [Leucobacter luti]QYM77025.1 S-layer homology domain-containing protein [Leucobacter luti]